MLTYSDIVYVGLTAGELELARRMAVAAEIGGKSNFRGSERKLLLSIDQFIGVGIGELAGNKYFFDVAHYEENRNRRNENPAAGDGGSDILGCRVDLKTSAAKHSNLLEFNLVVRPNERHPDTVYVLILVKTDGIDQVDSLIEKNPGAHIIGWASDDMLEGRQQDSGVFGPKNGNGGAYVIPARNLRNVSELACKLNPEKFVTVSRSDKPISRRLTTDDAYRLLMEGQRALSRVEANGMRIDTAYLERAWTETEELLQQKESELKSGEIWNNWRRVYGSEANLDSGEQLGHIIFNVMGVPCDKRTPTGKPKVDEEALEKVKYPWIQQFVTRKKLFTARNTFLAGIRREVVDGFLHPVFSLNKVISYRSSASLPNSQNFPNRIDRTARLVRQAFIPLDEDYEIAEFDLKGAEVCVSYCYHQDPTMGDYLRRGHDYHKDLACQCYMLDKSQVTKLVRGEAKADFVFSSFYGSWWPNIATKMWEAIETDNLCRVDGVGLLQHLAEKGITKLGTGDREPEPGTFQAHIANVYDDFWHNRFKRYSEWKDEVWQDYLAKGYCQSHTGFIYQGLANRREVINYRIQGSSFHCLLWCLIEVNEWLLAHNMKSRIIGQIHDSIVMDIHRKEHDDVVWFVTDTIRRRIREEWPWIIIQLEAEAAKSGENWYAKKEFELPKTTTAA